MQQPHKHAPHVGIYVLFFKLFITWVTVRRLFNADILAELA
jgi:hypothetical protein